MIPMEMKRGKKLDTNEFEGDRLQFNLPINDERISNNESESYRMLNF